MQSKPDLTKPINGLDQELTRCFRERGFLQPSAEARFALRFFLGLDQNRLQSTAPLLADEQQRLTQALERRLNHEPWQYIEGTAVFGPYQFRVGPGCLIPREDSFLMVEAIVHLSRQFTSILDWGTGSGCLGITLALQFPQSQVSLVDISQAALQWATLNCEEHNVTDRVTVDIVQHFDDYSHWNGDLLISNPPYLTSKEMNETMAELRFEPSIALDGGEQGVNFYQPLIDYAAQHLEQDGVLALEYGSAHQLAVLNRWCAQKGFVKIVDGKDFSSLPRFSLWSKTFG